MGRSGKPPEISVLIATRDRARLLEATLLALRQQRLGPIGWEVIVVDNGSVDNTSALLSTFRESLPLTVLHEQMPGKSGALNRALEVAQGDLLVFTDDDVGPATSWLAEIYKASRRWMTCSIFCGPIIPNYPSGAPSWLQQRPYASVAFGKFEFPLPEGPLPDKRTPHGANFAVRARAMRGIRFSTQVGPNGKSYAMGCETELLERLVSHGERIVYIPSAWVKHFIGQKQLKLKWLYKRAFHAGRGQFYREPDSDVALLLCMPRWGVRRALEAAADCALSLFRGREKLCASGYELFLLLGLLYEHRLGAVRFKQHPDGTEEQSIMPPKREETS